MITARRETPFRFTGDFDFGQRLLRLTAYGRSPQSFCARDLGPAALGRGGGRSSPATVGSPRTRGGLFARRQVRGRGHGEAVSEQPLKGKGEAALFSPPEDRTMPGKSNNGSSKDSDRWKVKAIPFPPSAERRDTGFREYQPGVLYPRSGGSSPTSPQPTQGGWKYS
ncbi:uncharacterized protein LOC119374900 [Rhipicephalus sanguineus]|uniref:uncharacterized protein LOC119374900 n=1 Tax=Rhipicephalus sanguineus TaxID=34632 RepID=UPI0018941783|nr:uncharacterized protein LOC119374900 [Rhipicephalus sanguineus]